MNIDDFNKYNDVSETGAEFIPYNPVDYSPLDCKIITCSASSRRFKKVQRELIKSNIKGGDSEDFAIKILAGLIIGWENIQKGSEDLECTEENVIMILKAQDWLYIQLLSFVETPSNFFLTE